MPYSRLCCTAPLAYRNLMRWKQRIENGLPVVERTGPKKVVKPDMGQLRQDIINKMLEAGILKSKAPEADIKAAKSGKGGK